MRWVSVKKLKPELGSFRNRTRFAWMPVKVGDTMVWLEKYIVTERYNEEQQYVGYGHWGYVKRWVVTDRYFWIG